MMSFVTRAGVQEGARILFVERVGDLCGGCVRLQVLGGR